MKFLGFYLYQIVVSVVAIFMIAQGFRRYLRKETGQTILKLFLRIAVWGGMAAVSLYPSLTDRLAGLIGLQGNVNAVILTGFILMFLVVFKLLSTIERIEAQISILTRKEALKEFRKKEKA